jgi:hypothetical protein
MGRVGLAHRDTLFQLGSEHQIESDVFAQNAVGEEKSGGFVRVDFYELSVRQ